MQVIPVSRTRLLVQVAPDVDPAEAATEVTLVAGATYRAAPSGSARGGPDAPGWLVARPASTTRRVHPWDLAHDYASRSSTRAVAPVRFVEPDFEQRFVYETPQSRVRSFSGSRDCTRRGADPDWPSRPQFAWHLGDGFSQLASARAVVGEPDGDRPGGSVSSTRATIPPTPPGRRGS